MDCSGNISDMIGSILLAGHGASRSRLNYEFNKLQNKRMVRRHDALIRQRYHKLLHVLKRDGLITEKLQNDESRKLKLTPAGLKKLKELKMRLADALPPINYNKSSTGRLTIVVFDVPERERKKRNWLRTALVSIGLEMVQQSVWIGKVKLPPEFIADLNILKMTDYIEILEVTKSGTYKNLL